MSCNQYNSCKIHQTMYLTPMTIKIIKIFDDKNEVIHFISGVIHARAGNYTFKFNT